MDEAAAELRVIDEIPDVDEHDGLSQAMSGLSVASGNGADAADLPDIDEIPDMEEDLEGEDDATVAAPKKASTPGVIDAG